MASNPWFRSALVLALHIICTNAYAQTNISREKLGNIRISVEIADGSFVSALSSISAETHASIIADDSPIASAHPFSVSGSATEVLDDICKRFDYDWQLTQSGEIVLSKRFSNPAEHPQFDRYEAADIAGRVVRILRRLPTVPDSHEIAPTLQRLYGSLSQQQLIQSRSSNPPRVADLAPAQQQLVTAAVIHDAFGKILTHWEMLASQLAGFDQSKIEGKQSDQPSERATPSNPGLPTRITYCWDRAGRTCKVLLPHHPSGYVEIPHISTPPLIDSPAPAPLSSPLSEAIKKPMQLKAGLTTLGDLADQITHATGVSIDLTAGLKQHQLVLATGSINAERILNVVAAIGGWEWYPTGLNSIALTYRKAAPISTPEEVSAAIRATMPPSWIRFLGYVPDDDTTLVAGSKAPGTTILKQLGIYESTAGMEKRNRQLADLTSEYCAIVMKGVPRNDGASIPNSSLAPEQQQALVNCLVLDTLHRFCNASSGASGIIHKQARPYQRDPSSAVIVTDARGISVYTLISQQGAHGRMGFGAPIASPGR